MDKFAQRIGKRGLQAGQEKDGVRGYFDTRLESPLDIGWNDCADVANVRIMALVDKLNAAEQKLAAMNTRPTPEPSKSVVVTEEMVSAFCRRYYGNDWEGNRWTTAEDESNVKSEIKASLQAALVRQAGGGGADPA